MAESDPEAPSINPDLQVLERIKPLELWKKLKNQFVLTELNVRATVIQLRALDEACIVFQNEEMISFENTSNIQGLDQAMKSALKRSASAMKAFYKAVVRSVDKPGSGAHKAIAEKILEMAKELEQKTFKLHDSFDPQATRFVPGPADMAKEEVHSMPNPDLNALKHQEMLIENDKDLKELNNTEEDDPPLIAVQSDLPSSSASSKGTSVPDSKQVFDEKTEHSQATQDDLHPEECEMNEEEIPVLFLEQFILTPKTPLKHFQELANKLKVNHTEYNKICLSEKDKPEVKKIALMKLIKNVIITKRMSLFKVACKIVESGPKLCRIAFHTSSPYPMFQSYEHDSPLWKSLTDHLGVSWDQLAKRLGFNEKEVGEIKTQSQTKLNQQLLDFCHQIKLPSLSEVDTVRLIVHMLNTASLHNVADSIKEDLGISTKVKMPSSGEAYKYYNQGATSDQVHCSTTTSNFMEQENYNDFDSINDSEKESKAEKTQLTSSLASKPFTRDEDFESARLQQSLPVNVNTSEEEDMSDNFVVASHPNPKVVTMIEDELESEEAIVREIQDLNGLVVQRERDGKQPIHAAAERGCIKALNALLAYQNDINAQMKDGSTAVSLTLEKDKFRAFRLLISSGANLSLKMKEGGMTPFLMACQRGYADFIYVMIEKHPEIAKQRDMFGRCCLHFPAVLRDNELLQYLIVDCGVDATTPSKNGVPPLSVACAIGEEQAVETLWDHSDRTKDYDGRMPPLHAAALSGHMRIIKNLIRKYQFNVDGKNQELFTALHLASAMDHLNIVKFLVERCGADIDAKSIDSSTPLTMACTAGNLRIVEYLVGKEADIENLRELSRDVYHLTPLTEAVLGRHVDIVNFLLEKKANYKFVSGGQLSILAHACMGGDKEIIVMLLDKLEEDITTYSETDLAHEIYGRPLKVCLDFNNYGCARLLLQRLGVSNAKQIIDLIKTWRINGVKADILESLRNVTGLMDPSFGDQLHDEGDGCRRVAGSRHCLYYHVCYDDGPQWATEIMKMALMFADFYNLTIFRQCYMELFAEVCKCLVITVLNRRCNGSKTSLAMQAESTQAATFFQNLDDKFTIFENPELFLEVAHQGNPSAMGTVCHMTNKEELLMDSKSNIYSTNVPEYFAEMARRDEHKPNQFRLHFGVPAGYNHVKSASYSFFGSSSRQTRKSYRQRPVKPRQPVAQKSKQSDKPTGSICTGESLAEASQALSTDQPAVSNNEECTPTLECVSDINEPTQSSPPDEAVLPFPEPAYSVTPSMLERENRESSTSVEREKRESGPSVEGETLEEPKTEELNFPLEEPVVGIAEHVESEVEERKVLEQTLQERINQLQEEKKLLEQQVQTKDEQLKVTNEKLEEEQMSRVSEETKLKMHIEKYKERIQKVSEDRFHIEQELTKLKHETAPLLFTDQDEKVEEMRMELRMAKNKMAELEQSFQKKNEEVITLQKEQRHLIEVKDNLTSENQSLTRRLETVNMEYKTLKEREDKEKQKCIESERKATADRRENAQLKKKVEEQKTELEALKGASAN